MSYHFLTFGTEKYYPSVERILSEAESLNLFTTLKSISDKDLQFSYYEKYPHIFDLSARGKHGYWTWKPLIILQRLQEITEGDYLLYLDSRSHFTCREDSKERLISLFNEANPILAHSLSDPERGWTKRETLKYFNIDETEEMETIQRMGGIIFIKNNEKSRSFINEWLNLMIEHHELVDDSKDLAIQHPRFVDHRHDQSLFSIMSKREKFPSNPIHSLGGLIRFHYS